MSEQDSVLHNVLELRADAERRAIDNLARYKFDRFGYYCSRWVTLNSVLTKKHKQPNPFRSLVKFARDMKQNSEPTPGTCRGCGRELTSKASHFCSTVCGVQTLGHSGYRQHREQWRSRIPKS